MPATPAMPRLEALQHVACNVERGYFPNRGPGFQTVAMSPELEGTPDLKKLETVAPYYEVAAARRGAGTFPVKETFFYLPSGRAAIGRTVDWGTGPSGREGNYL